MRRRFGKLLCGGEFFADLGSRRRKIRQQPPPRWAV
jgi:hypothetical protein